MRRAWKFRAKRGNQIVCPTVGTARVVHDENVVALSKKSGSIFLHLYHMRRYWFYVKNHFWNFHQIFTFWDPLSQKKRFLEKALSVCLSVCNSTLKEIHREYRPFSGFVNAPMEGEETSGFRRSSLVGTIRE